MQEQKTGDAKEAPFSHWPATGPSPGAAADRSKSNETRHLRIFSGHASRDPGKAAARVARRKREGCSAAVRHRFLERTKPPPMVFTDHDLSKRYSLVLKGFSPGRQRIDQGEEDGVTQLPTGGRKPQAHCDSTAAFQVFRESRPLRLSSSPASRHFTWSEPDPRQGLSRILKNGISPQSRPRGRRFGRAGRKRWWQGCR